MIYNCALNQWLSINPLQLIKIIDFSMPQPPVTNKNQPQRMLFIFPTH